MHGGGLALNLPTRSCRLLRIVITSKMALVRSSYETQRESMEARERFRWIRET